MLVVYEQIVCSTSDWRKFRVRDHLLNVFAIIEFDNIVLSPLF